MGKYEKQRTVGGVVFGRWKLAPCSGKNANNWELYRDGRSTGRYYQYNTVANALEYAADVEAKRGCTDAERDIRDAIGLYRKTLERFRTAFWQGHSLS